MHIIYIYIYLFIFFIFICLAKNKLQLQSQRLSELPVTALPAPSLETQEGSKGPRRFPNKERAQGLLAYCRVCNSLQTGFSFEMQ